MSLHISQIGQPTVSMFSYPWPWRPQDMHQVSETGICHGTKVSHHLNLPRQSRNDSTHGSLALKAYQQNLYLEYYY